MAEAAQVAGEVVSRLRVGLCDRAARQGAVLVNDKANKLAERPDSDRRAWPVVG